MKIVLNIIKWVLVLMVLAIILSTYVEFITAKRAYEFSNKILLNGDYLKFFKTIEDAHMNRVNSSRYIYGVFKIRLIWELSIVGLLMLFFFLKKKEERKPPPSVVFNYAWI